MKLTTKEFKELHEWSNAFEELAQMSKTVGKSLSEVKKIDGLMTNIEYKNLDEKCAYEKLESHFKEQIEKANDFVRECEYMLGIVNILKNGIEEVAECDGEISACATICEPNVECVRDPKVVEIEKCLNAAIKEYENKMY